jgi:tetratricopeptide (TPR) repeat protein
MSGSLPDSMAQAASLQIAGKLDESLAVLHRAKAAGHESSKLSCAIGHLQFELGEYEAAAASFGELVQCDAQDSSAQFNLGVALEKTGAWEQAALAFRKAIELDPRRTGAQLGLGMCLLHLEQPADALAALEICLERQPFRESALRGKAAALQMLNRSDEAIELYQKLLFRDPQSEELLATLMGLAIERCDYESLAVYARRQLDSRPQSLLGLECLALAAFGSRDYDGAVRDCAALVEAHPQSFAGWFNSGVALQKIGRFQEAVDAYSRAAALDPASTEVHLNLGTVLHEVERWDDARAAYERALALDPTQKTALCNLALLCEQRQQFQEAQTYYEALVAHYPDAQEAWFRLGYLRLERGDTSGCIEAFERCRKSPDVLMNMGLAHWKTGNRDEAESIFRQILALVPKSANSLQCLAAIAIERQDFKQALTLHKQLLELSEPTAELLYNTALVLQKLGRPADSVKYYRQALAERPDFPQALLNLGHALMVLGNHEEAHSSWEAAVRSDGNLAEHFLM